MKSPIEETSHHSIRRAHQRSEHPSASVEDVRDLPVAKLRKPRKRLIIAIAAIALLALGWVVLRRSGRAPVLPTVAPAIAMEGSRIRFTEEFATRHKVATAKVVESPLSPTIQVLGTVRYDVRKFAAVGARSAGRVRRVMKIVGEEVKPGDILADIESVELGKAQAMAEALRAREIAAASNLEREQQLAKAKVTALREAETAKAEHLALRAERRAAEKAVAALGGDLESEVGILKLRSPIHGRVIASKASRGQTVEPSDTLFEVADLSKVWVELQVFERDLHRIHEGDAVKILLPAPRGATLEGKLGHVSDLVNPETRSAVVRVEVPNDQGLLRPGQSTTALIQSRGPLASALVVPKESVTFVDGKPTVLALIGPGLVEPRPVDLGPDDGERVTIRKGLRVGESVITEGLFALKSEIFR